MMDRTKLDSAVLNSIWTRVSDTVSPNMSQNYLRRYRQGEKLNMQLKSGIIMNAQAEIKGISTYNEANGTALKNHNSWSTHVLQPVARWFFSSLLHFLSPQKGKMGTNSVGGGHGQPPCCCCEVVAF